MNVTERRMDRSLSGRFRASASQFNFTTTVTQENASASGVTITAVTKVRAPTDAGALPIIGLRSRLRYIMPQFQTISCAWSIISFTLDRIMAK